MRSPARGSRPLRPESAQRSVSLPDAPAASRWTRLATEVTLALPPTVVVLLAILLIERFSHQRVLFGSLAGSAFLIYYDPLHRINTVRVMVTAQLLACVLGIGAVFAFGSGYLAAALAMTATIALLIGFDIVHPPAIGTALGFAFTSPHDTTIVAFIAAMSMVAVLIVLQRLALWMLSRVEARFGDRE